MTAPLDSAPDGRRPRSILRAAIQILGFAICLGLLWFCARRALAPENREQIQKLGDATVAQAAALVALSLISLIINGSVFWLVVRPVKRLPYPSTIAVNAVATLLALLPFKLSMLFRILIHKVRDKVPVLTGGAWLAAAAVIILSGLLPPVAASAWRHRAHASVDSAWWTATIALYVVGGTTLILLARAFATPRGWDRVERALARFPQKRLHAVLLPRAHEGVRMLADPLVVAAGLALRSADIAVQTARFLLAASIVGVELPLDQAIIGASVYFLIGAAAPTGSLGARESGTVGVFALLGSGPPYVIMLLVSATDMLVVLTTAVLSAAYLRLDRVVRIGPGPKM